MHTSSVDLRPLGLGEIVDRSVNFWRTQLFALFKLYLGLQLVSYILSKSFTLAAEDLIAGLQDGSAINEAAGDPVGLMLKLMLFGAGALVFVVAVTWLTWVGAAVGTRYTLSALVGQPTTLGEAFRFTAARLGTLTGVLVVTLFWGMGVMLLASLPGVAVIGGGVAVGGVGAAVLGVLGVLLLGFGLVCALLWYVLRFLLVAQVVVMEDAGIGQAIRRSGELISGRIGPGFLDLVKVRATILLTVVALILTVAAIVAGLPAIIVGIFYTVDNLKELAQGMQPQVPQLLLIPAELFQVVGYAFVAPLYMVFSAIFYLDMRVRREGLDLQLRTQALVSPTPGTPAAPPSPPGPPGTL